MLHNGTRIGQIRQIFMDKAFILKISQFKIKIRIKIRINPSHPSNPCAIALHELKNQM